MHLQGTMHTMGIVMSQVQYLLQRGAMQESWDDKVPRESVAIL